MNNYFESFSNYSLNLSNSYLFDTNAALKKIAKYCTTT